MSDHDVYQRIGSMLLGVCPPNAVRVVLRAEMSQSGDYFGPDVEYMLPDGHADQADLMSIAHDLRLQFVEVRRLTVGKGKAPWSSILLTLDAATGKIEISFGYDDLGL